VRRAEELVDRIVNSSQIPSGRRKEIQRELLSHIDDFVSAALEAGHDEMEIEKLLLANFGDPDQIGKGFAWVYRHERRGLRAVVFALSTILLASALLAAVLAIQTGLALGFRTPVMEVLTSRHTVTEALDILASVAAYLCLPLLESLFKSHQFQKGAFLLTAIDGALIALCAAVGLHTSFLFFGLIDGLLLRAVQLFITSRAARFGLGVVSFPVAGAILAVLRSPVSEVALAATCASWLAMGIGYQLMIHLASRVDAALLNGLQRGS